MEKGHLNRTIGLPLAACDRESGADLQFEPLKIESNHATRAYIHHRSWLGYTPCKVGMFSCWTVPVLFLLGLYNPLCGFVRIVGFCPLCVQAHPCGKKCQKEAAFSMPRSLTWSWTWSKRKPLVETAALEIVCPFPTRVFGILFGYSEFFTGKFSREWLHWCVTKSTRKMIRWQCCLCWSRDCKLFVAMSARGKLQLTAQMLHFFVPGKKAYYL